MQAQDTVAGESTVLVRRQRRRLPWIVDLLRRLAREKLLGLIGLVLVAVMALMALLAPLIAPYDPTELHGVDRLTGPSATYWLGTDNLGRDIFSRLVYGAQTSMKVGLAAVVLSSVAALVLGVVSGYIGGWFDTLFQRFIDALIAFPGLILVLTIMAILGTSLNNVILALAITGAASGSRVIRSATLSVRQLTYVEAAYLLGARAPRIVLFHVVPNVMAPVITLATLGLGAAILAESSLSFLGLGVPPPAPTWGGMLSGAGRQYMLQAPWMAFFPGLFLSLAVFGFNMLGDALRDLLDPRLRGSR